MKDFKSELNKIKGKTLMVIFPHPDDESMMTGGLLSTAHKLGIRTVVVTMTKGGAGKIHIHPKGKSTTEVRYFELKKACERLCVSKLYVSDFPDGNLVGEKSKWSMWLMETIKNEKPKLIVTYDTSGLTGHPDHIILSKEVLSIAHERNLNLYWVSLSEKLKKWFVPKEVEGNICEPTHVLDFGNLWIKKWLAVKSHKSQRYAQVRITFPLFLYLSIYHFEWYHKVDFKRIYKVKYMDFKI